MARLELYIPVGKERLRCGYTTGTCAAAAAAGAAELLLTGARLPAVRVGTPAGVTVEAELLQHAAGEGWACCAVRKDGGGRPGRHPRHPDRGPGGADRVPRRRYRRRGGGGPGDPARPGPAGRGGGINSVPRRMIAEQVRRAMDGAGYAGGLRVTISAPEGEKLAARTFNPRLGIVGGISILGTSGIVKPMSEAALMDSIYLEMDQRRELGTEDLLLTPGNYGERFARQTLGLSLKNWCMCSNYLGAAIDHAAALGFRSLLVVGHLGKLVKAAAGCMNTHSQISDARRETLAAHAALAGAERELVQAVFDAPTTDAAVGLLKEAGLLEPVMASIGQALDGHLKRRAGERLAIEALFFSNQYGILGKTPGAEALLALHRAAPDGETAGG